MKILTTVGLTELITKIKTWSRATFLNNTDVEQTTAVDILESSTVDVDTAPTASSTNLVSSGGVYTALDAKQNTIIGAASTITSTNLTADKSLISSADGKVAVSDTTSTELGYVHGTTSNIQDQFTAANQRIDDISAIGRFLSYWNCSTGLAATDPITSPYTYHTGDYFVVSAVASEGSANYKPNGSTYTTGVASTTVESSTVAPQDIYRYDGTNWSLSKNTQPDLSGYVATFSQSFTDAQKQQARANIGAGTSSFSGSYNDLTNKPTIPTVTLNGTETTSPSFYSPINAGFSGQVLVSNGNGAPTWQTGIKKYIANNPALTASEGVWTWTIESSIHEIGNSNLIVSVYEISTGEQVIADVKVDSSTYAVTFTVVDYESIGTLADGTYRAVIIG